MYLIDKINRILIAYTLNDIKSNETDTIKFKTVTVSLLILENLKHGQNCQNSKFEKIK